MPVLSHGAAARTFGSPVACCLLACLLLLKCVAHPWTLKSGVKPRQGKPGSVNLDLAVPLFGVGQQLGVLAIQAFGLLRRSKGCIGGAVDMDCPKGLQYVVPLPRRSSFGCSVPEHVCQKVRHEQRMNSGFVKAAPGVFSATVDACAVVCVTGESGCTGAASSKLDPIPRFTNTPLKNAPSGVLKGSWDAEPLSLNEYGGASQWRATYFTPRVGARLVAAIGRICVYSSQSPGEHRAPQNRGGLPCSVTRP